MTVSLGRPAILGPAARRAPADTGQDDTAPYLSFAGALVALGAAVLLCWPMLVSSAPLIFTDTISYWSNGEALWFRLLVLAGGIVPGLGEQVVQAAASSGVVDEAAGGNVALTLRSLPYSAFLYPTALTPAGLVLTCILQTAMTLWVFLGLVPPLTAAERTRALAGFAAVGTLTTLPWFASYAMPDLLGAVLPIYYALALRRIDGVGLVRQILLGGLAAFAVMAHYGNLPLALVLAVGVLLWRAWSRRFTPALLAICLVPVIVPAVVNMAISAYMASLGPPASVAASSQEDLAGQDLAAPGQAEAAPGQAEAANMLAAARLDASPAPAPTSDPAPALPAAGPAATQAASPAAIPAAGPAAVPAAIPAPGSEPAAIEGVSLTPNRIPALLARSVGDGPGRWYLQEECDQGATYAVCELFDTIPDNMHDFLWVGIGGATDEQMTRIRAEEMGIVLAAFRRYPLEQIGATLTNAGQQFVMIGTSDLWLYTPEDQAKVLNDVRVTGPNSQRNDTLRAFDWITLFATGAALLVLVWRVATGRTRHFLTEVVLLVLFALIVNAAIFGGLSAPVDRYQSRLAWLIPALLALDLALRPHVARAKPLAEQAA